MALTPQIGLSISSGIAVVLFEEGFQVAARTKVCKGLWNKRERSVKLPQFEVKDKILTVIQPFRVAVYNLPNFFPKGNGPAGGQKAIGINIG
jgi:hypothetical protein